MKIFFDLDGTLIDARKRLFLLFQHLVPQSTFSFDDYWNLKRNKQSHQLILENIFLYTYPEFQSFNKQWMELIEREEWLQYDKPFEGVTEFLLGLQEKHELYLVTARQHEPVIKEQIKRFGWECIFKKILVTCQRVEKVELIKGSGCTEHTDWLVGDTGNDIRTGKLLGMRTAAVLSGFLNKEQLKLYEPDVIVQATTDLTYTFNLGTA